MLALQQSMRPEERALPCAGAARALASLSAHAIHRSFCVYRYVAAIAASASALQRLALVVVPVFSLQQFLAL